MKKLFISCPMRGRTEKDIKETMDRMAAAARTIIGEEVCVIPSFISGLSTDRNEEKIRMLGKSIQLMADADYVVNLDVSYEFPGCNIERNIADSYGIPIIHLQAKYLAPDVDKMLQDRYPVDARF